MHEMKPVSKKPLCARVILALMCVYLFWGGTYLGMKIAVETIPPFLMTGMRFSLAGWVLYAIVRLRGEPRPTWVEVRNAGIAGALMLVCGNSVVAMAEQTVPSSIASLLIATTPLWITGISAVLEHKKPGLGSVVGIVMGLAGVAVLVWNPGSSGGHGASLWGIVAIIAASVAWSSGTVVSRRARMPKAPLLATALQMIVGGALLLAVAGIHGDFVGFSFAHVSQSSWLAMGYLIVFGSMLGYTAYVWLFRNTEPSIAATYAYVNPIVAMLVGWLLAGEQLGVNALIAAVIIIASVVVITRFRGSATKPSAARGAEAGATPLATGSDGETAVLSPVAVASTASEPDV